jgi:hypothetical protein
MNNSFFAASFNFVAEAMTQSTATEVNREGTGRSSGVHPAGFTALQSRHNATAAIWFNLLDASVL